MYRDLPSGHLVGLYLDVLSPVTQLSSSLLFCHDTLSCARKYECIVGNPEARICRSRFCFLITAGASEGMATERENPTRYKLEISKVNSQFEVVGLNNFSDLSILETRRLLYNSLFDEFKCRLGSYLNLIALDVMKLLIGYTMWLKVNLYSCNDEVIPFVRSLMCPVYIRILIQQSGKLRWGLGLHRSVPLLSNIHEIDDRVQNLDSTLVHPDKNLDTEQSLSKATWIQEFAKKSRKKCSEKAKAASNECKDPPPPVEKVPEAPKPEHKPRILDVDPRIVWQPVEPYNGLQLGSRLDGLRIIPGDIMITRWSRPPYDPPGASDPMANPGGHCTLFVDHAYFERKRKEVCELEHMLDKCFDEGDMILRFGQFDVYWLWSPLSPLECFEFQWYTPPPCWFLFSRAQAKPLLPPMKTFNRRWMVVGRQQPDIPDAQAIRPRLGDIIVRRAEALVWWQINFKFQTGDLLIRAGYERVSNSDKTLAAVEMYECRVNSFTEFMGRISTVVHRINWTFLGRDMQYYGPGMVGQGGMSVHFNGPSGRPLSNRGDLTHRSREINEI